MGAALINALGAKMFAQKSAKISALNRIRRSPGGNTNHTTMRDSLATAFGRQLLATAAFSNNSLQYIFQGDTEVIKKGFPVVHKAETCTRHTILEFTSRSGDVGYLQLPCVQTSPGELMERCQSG